MAVNSGPRSAHPDADALRSWMREWGAEVAARRFEVAAGRFADDVVGFGTKATVARGLDELMATQWRHVWPAIDDFAFEPDDADLWISPDRLLATIALGWTSTGRNPDGSTFPRRGRATVVVRRTAVDEPWLGCHTHFSLEPLDPGTYLGSPG